MENFTQSKSVYVSMFIMLVLTVLLIAFPTLGNASEEDEIIEDELKYRINEDGTFTVVQYLGVAGKDVIIKEQIDGKDVTQINSGVFYGRTLSSISIPNTVTRIGDATFQGATIPEIVLPDSITTIGSASFNNIKADKIVLSNNIKEISSVSFSNAEINELIMPNSVTKINSSAFQYAEIPNFSLSEQLKEIGSNAFANFKSNNLTIPDSVDEIGSYAFNALNLEGDLTIGNGASIIPDRSFGGATMTNLTLGNGVKEIGNYAFSDGDIKNIDLGEGVKRIGEFAFHNTRITEITIPSSTETIERYAFATPTLEKAVINGDNLKIGDWSFTYSGSGGESNLAEVTLNEGIQEIGGYAFYENKLTKVNIPDSVHFIGPGAFYGNEITSVTGMNNVREIGIVAFSRNNLERVVIPKNVESVGNWSFSENNLSEIVFQNSSIEFDRDEVLDKNQENPIDLTVVGYPASTSENYANEYGYSFRDGTGDFSYETKGSSDISKYAEIIVEAFNNDENELLEYAWSTNDETPTEQWVTFNNGDVLQTPDGLAGELYLFTRGKDILGNNIERYYGALTVDSISPSPPKIEFPDGWVNHSVVISIADGLDEHSEIEKTEYRINGSDWLKYESEIELKDEGVYTIEARTIDEPGNLSDVTIAEVKIDKTKPNLVIEKIENSNKLLITASDSLSGVKEITLPDGSIVELESTELTIEKNGQYEIIVTDFAGNKTTELIEVNVSEDVITDFLTLPLDDEDGDKNGKTKSKERKEKSAGALLPDTATNIFTIIIAGAALILSGLIVLLIAKKKKIKNQK